METILMGMLLLPKGPLFGNTSIPEWISSDPHLGHFPCFTFTPPYPEKPEIHAKHDSSVKSKKLKVKSLYVLQYYLLMY